MFISSRLIPAILPLLIVTGGSISVLPAAAAGLSTDQRVERLERRMNSLTDLIMQVDALKRENSELRGQIELQSHTIESMKKRQRDLYIDIDQRLSGMHAPAPAAAAGNAPAAMEPAAAQPSLSAPSSAPAAALVSRAPVVAQPQSTTVSSAERAEYNAAFKLLSPAEKRYAEAISAYNAFLKKYPAGGLADNAQYWLAEANYVSQNNDQALIEFEKVVTLYPNSTKVSGALLKIGYLQDSAGQTEQAKQTLSRVIKDYPGSAAANMAKNRLQRIETGN